MKILIVSTYFPPQNSIASLRPYSWAKYWTLAGHQVTVLTVSKDDNSLNMPMPNNGFCVIEVPVPRIQFLKKIFFRKVIKASTEINEAPENGRGKSIVRAWFSRIQKRYGIAYAGRMPDPMDLWIREALASVEDKKWDLIVSTAGPYCVHAVAYALSKKKATSRWVADWRDLWVDNPSYPGLPPFRWFERYLEKRWCNYADVVTTVSEPLAEVLRKKYGNKVSVIFNGFDSDDYDSLPKELHFPQDGIVRIIYTGSIYKWQRDPTPLFQAISKLSICGAINPGRLQVLFCGNNANVNELAAREGVAEYVQYMGIVPRQKALHMQRDASALLLLEFESGAVKGVLTGKLFEYLFAGPPILAVGVGQNSSIGDVLAEAERGRACGNDCSQIIDFLLELLKTPVMKSAEMHGVDTRLNFYSRRVQAERMLKVANSKIE